MTTTPENSAYRLHGSKLPYETETYAAEVRRLAAIAIAEANEREALQMVKEIETATLKADERTRPQT